MFSMYSTNVSCPSNGIVFTIPCTVIKQTLHEFPSKRGTKRVKYSLGQENQVWFGVIQISSSFLLESAYQ